MTSPRGTLSLLTALALAVFARALPASGQIVARIGETTLTIPEYEARARSLRETGYRHLRSMDLAAKRELLDGIIARELLALEGQRRNLDEDPAIAAELARYERRALMRALYDSQALRGDYTSTEPELRAFYHDKQLDVEVLSRQIICATEGEARLVAQQLAAGADFDSLLAVHTLPDVRQRFGPSGSVGWLRVGVLYETLRQQLATLPVGSYSPVPVRSNRGYHVFLVEGRRPVPFESSVDLVRDP